VWSHDLHQGKRGRGNVFTAACGGCCLEGFCDTRRCCLRVQLRSGNRQGFQESKSRKGWDMSTDKREAQIIEVVVKNTRQSSGRRVKGVLILSLITIYRKGPIPTNPMPGIKSP
jgi:hypothetical protein